jgi:GAF domain-containing protein
MARAGAMMAKLSGPLDTPTVDQIDAALQQLENARELGPRLISILDIVIGLAGADMGTLQRFDEGADCLKLVASRGLSSEAQRFFGVVRRDTSTSCAAALTRRMRVFVENVSTSYLFVGTRELEVLLADGVAAIQSTPLISSNGRLWGVLSTYFRDARRESDCDLAPLDRLATQIADSLNARETRLQLRIAPEDCSGGD